jgi:hypothetical protein
LCFKIRLHHKSYSYQLSHAKTKNTQKDFERPTAAKSSVDALLDKDRTILNNDNTNVFVYLHLFYFDERQGTQQDGMQGKKVCWGRPISMGQLQKGFHFIVCRKQR